MGWYLLKLVILLPLIGVLAWGCLWLARRMQERVGTPAAGRSARRSVRVVETLMLSPTLRLAVIEFHGREILVSASRQGLATLAEAPARTDLPGGSMSEVDQ